jgi:hypothetical protein
VLPSTGAVLPLTGAVFDGDGFVKAARVVYPFHGTRHRLMLHGLAAKHLHAYLVKQKTPSRRAQSIRYLS